VNKTVLARIGIEINKHLKVLLVGPTLNYTKMQNTSNGLVVFRDFIHSFIHTEHLYSVSSRELLRGAPDSSTAKKSSV